MQRTHDLPLRGSTAVEMLVNDHEVIRVLLTELTGESTASQRKQTFERLKAALTLHNATEENLVYPALAIEAGKKTESVKLYHETAAADMLVYEIDVALHAGDEHEVTSKAKKLEAAILEHMEDEEQKAFPHLEKHADETATEMLTASVRKFRGDLHFGSAG